jgi:hypothetical protein
MKPDPIGTGDLFDATPYDEGKARRPAGQKASAVGKCPCCHKAKVGLLRQGNHFVWREHTYRTWSGAPMTCRASGVTVCVAPEGEPRINSDPLMCPHDARFA